MKRLAPFLLLLTCVVALAQDKRPELPKVPPGFDDGRAEVIAEVADELISPEKFPGRLFEEADTAELAAFLFSHLSDDEKALLDTGLNLDGALPRCRDAAAIEALLAKQAIGSVQVCDALGKLLAGRRYSLRETVAWFYARGFNFRVLQSALNGERIDCFMLRRGLREMAAKGTTNAELFEKAFWDFNLKDGRQELGGHYDGVQLIESLLALGWGPAEFASAMGLKDAAGLKPVQRDLISWGDPVLLWPALEHGMPESDWIKAVRAWYAKGGKGESDNRVLSCALARAETVSRWFRTGGPQVTGVYTGPWPDAKGEPQPPVAELRAIQEGDEARIAGQLSEAVRGHFSAAGDTFLLVIYADGSGRAIIRKPKRKPVNLGAPTPLGNVAHTDQLYEGRVSIKGRSALMYAVFTGGEPVSPAEFEFANLDIKAGGTLLGAHIDDGVQLMPILLKRTSRLVDAP
ncbi:MAG: hypothetical protein IPK87_10840 [Planctomycetes bacterium]|nr:hypothetical protein [Planctomycetota bacterium]